MNQLFTKDVHGFHLLDNQYIDEIQATVYQLEHLKSGAKLLYIDAKDTNKVFSVSFRTPPKDSTGVAHITEHSVLCGSRKFPLKEPFVELVKGSLNTFLNAMTYPDKTMYPVASKNDKDFRNLMDVYLDAVFYPNVVQDPYIIKQEGWHYEIEDVNEPLTYKGVVYNEMKGVYSSADDVLDEKTMAVLFPDTTYGVDSGGDPKEITNLTFENFVSFYKEYYHPANSYFFLYGTMDIESQLQFIDEEYLSHFDRAEIHSEIAVQKPLAAPKTEAFAYNIASEESETGKAIHNLSFVSSEFDPKTVIALDVLNYALVASAAAPIKELLLKEKMGSDVSGRFVESLRQPMWSIIVSGSERDKAEAIREKVLSYLAEVVEKGLDKRLIEASLNRIEFSLREADFGGYPSGLLYNIRLMNQWLYGEDPCRALQYNEVLKELRDGLENSYYEDIIRKYILENTHAALVTAYPEKGLEAAAQAKEEEKLQAIKDSMTEEEIKALIEDTKTLKERQAAPDSPEALETIPVLSLSDLDPTVEEIAREQGTIANVTVHTVDVPTNGILYTNLYFNLDGFTEEEIKYTYMLSDLLGRFHTNTYTYHDLDTEIQLHLGGFTSTVTALPLKGENHGIKGLFSVHVKALSSQGHYIWHFLNEVLLHSKLNDTSRLQELVQELKANWDMDAFRKGHSLVSTRLMAQVSDVDRFQDCGSLGYYNLLAELLKADDMATVSAKLQAVAKKLLAKNRMEIALIGNAHEVESFKEETKDALAAWSEGEAFEKGFHFTTRFENEGIVSSGQVQYVAKGGSYAEHGYHFSGSMKVLETILKYDYLWTKIRVQGGAYGAFATFKPKGDVVFCSYRDPNLEETLAVYDAMPAYVSSMQISPREMQKYIIGTMSSLDNTLTPYTKGVTAMVRYFRNITASDVERIHRQVIGTTVEDLHAMGAMLDAVLKDHRQAAMGNEDKIRKATKEFTKIVSLPN